MLILNCKGQFHLFMNQETRIIPYSDIYAAAFKSLNEEWITKYFEMEKMDYKSLDHPKEYILDKGGYIAVALLNNEPVGVCALVPCVFDGYDLELVKMGVSPKAQGKGIGKLLGQHIIEKAKKMGVNAIFLESNRVLAPTISLYEKLGFKEVFGIKSRYARSDIKMELLLTD